MDSYLSTSLYFVVLIDKMVLRYLDTAIADRFPITLLFKPQSVAFGNFHFQPHLICIATRTM